MKELRLENLSLRQGVSVVIPCYNSENFIEETLKSVMAQQGYTPEIIVVDDGSTDKTKEIVSRFPVKLVTQKNSGDSAARGAGLKLVETDYVIFLDHDDVLEPAAIIHHIAGFKDQPDAVMMLGSNYLIDADSKQCGLNKLEPRRFTAYDVVMGTTPSFSQCMYRTKDLVRVGGFCPEAGSCADHDLNLRLLGWNHEGYIHGKIVMSYRLHAGQQTKSLSKQFRKHMEIIQKHFKKRGLPNDQQLLRRAEIHWAFYYGQFLPGELYRALARMHFRDAISVVGASLRYFPHGIRGAVSHVMKAARRRWLRGRN
jgi:glycosyltransferase involved in cell wall biosynthesis